MQKAAQLFPQGFLGEPDGAVACKKLLTCFQKGSWANLTVRWHAKSSSLTSKTGPWRTRRCSGMQKAARIMSKGFLGEPDGAVAFEKLLTYSQKGALGEPDGAMACEKLLT